MQFNEGDLAITSSEVEVTIVSGPNTYEEDPGVYYIVREQDGTEQLYDETELRHV